MSAKRLLVVDDDEDVAELILLAAKRSGFEAKWANGPDEIMAQYQSFSPDVIVLDVLMPDMDGLEVLSYLRENRSGTKIVILSGSEENSRRMTGSFGKALGLQVVANVKKPFVLAELTATLRKIAEGNTTNTA